MILLKTYVQSYSRVFIFCIALLTSSYIFANQSAPNFLTNDILLSDQSVVFQKSRGSADSIVKLYIHYLSSNDCQTGYTGVYISTGVDHNFSIVKGVPFGLNASSVYQAGLLVPAIKNIEEINSIMINLIGNNGRFVKFLGTCNDQGINCCVPVNCSNQTGSCLSKFDVGTQFFTDYIPPN